MLEENQENITPTNDEGVDQPEGQNGPDELKKAQEAYENQKVRAEKAEAELKKLKSTANEPNKSEETPKKSSEPDYYKDLTLRTYLKAEGVDSKEDQDWLLKESNELKKPIEDLLSKPYYQSELKTRKTQRSAEAGMPDGSGKSTGGVKSSVDYWVDKKDPKNPETYLNPPDPKLAREVIKARMERERERSEFPDMY